MTQYVLINRRAGKFTAQAKEASRAAVATTIARLAGNSRVVADKDPADETARRVVVFDADAAHVAHLRSTLPADAILEPLVRRKLHRHTPIELAAASPLNGLALGGSAATYKVTVKGGGDPLAGIEVMFYVRDPSGHIGIATATTDKQGRAKIGLPQGSSVSFVEPIPYSGFWIMLAEAPPSGSTIDCLPVAKASNGGGAWWHSAMGVDVNAQGRGAGLKVGVIDTGCGPHPNLGHVKLVGAYVDGHSLPGSQATDVAEHGTHTTGIVGARRKKAGDYAGMAPDCELFHARVFKGEGEGDGPSQADIVNAIDALSRDNKCDLINMSLGGGPPSEAEEDCIRDAAERGTLCICSAGNDAGPIEFPGAYAECSAVSAIGRIGWAPSGTFSSSNRPHVAAMLGQHNLFLAAFSCFGSTLACAAPGVGIVSTVPDKKGVTGAYMEMDGTSMASPAACGALAVILSQDAAYKALPRDISRTTAARNALAQHCVPFGLAVKFEGRGLPTV
ncbi:MAG TPA: S8 family serine peptidase [Casimicrobiaceae bacterium]|nr:S8 family serine peptidase [Casimicrobiaceae bacterium]